MRLYAVVDKKSRVAEYYLASCDEDAFRIMAVMMMSSKPMYEFAEDYFLQFVEDVPAVRVLESSENVLMDGFELRRQLDARREEREHGNKN